MKILWWPHTSSNKVASVRLRCFNIINTLKRNGLNVGLYKFGDAPDLIVLSKRYDDFSVGHVKQLREKYGTKIVLDLCDNHFYSQHKSEFWESRAAQLREAILAADMVIASSEELAKIIQEEFGELQLNIKVIEDTVESPYYPTIFEKVCHPIQELKLYSLQKKLARLSKYNVCSLVWFGNYGSENADGGMTDLKLIAENLNTLNLTCPISLTVISNNKNKFNEIKKEFNIPIFYLDWASSTFSTALNSHQICTIPIGINPFTKCKTNNRLATAFLHDVAVATTIIPSYEPFSEVIVSDDWNAGLKELAINKSYRGQLIANGKKLIFTNWSISLIAKKWSDMFQSINGDCNE